MLGAPEQPHGLAALGRPAPSTRHYLWKRALRILPLYWAVVVVALWLIGALVLAALWTERAEIAG